MQPTMTKKLMLTKETIRELTTPELCQVAGGLKTYGAKCMALTFEPACPPPPPPPLTLALSECFCQ